MSAIVRAINLHKQYKPPTGVVAVNDVSLDIEQGEIFSLLGPNGAGKTTIISMMSGLLGPTRGDVLIGGHSIKTASVKAKELLGVVPDEIALYREISARENLTFWGKMYGLGGQRLKQRIDAVIDIVGLGDRIDDKVEVFSGGMKRRLNIAAGLLHEPKVLLMDEPTVGIDPQSRRRILDTIKELNRAGLTLLHTTHYMEEAEELSDRIGIIDHGDLIALGSAAQLRQMIGEDETIKILLTSSNEAEKDMEELAKVPGVNHITREDEYFVLQVHNAKAMLPNIVNWTNNDGVKIKSLQIQEPNLESVFLHLTGRALRD